MAGEYEINLATFDGALFARKYGLDPMRDFHARGNKLILRDGVDLADNPPQLDFAVEQSNRRMADATARDRMEVLKAKIKSRTATLAEIMEYIEP